MKYLFMLGFFSFNLVAAEPITKFECGTYSQDLAKLLDPDKSYFKDTERRYPEKTEANNSELYAFSKQFSNEEERLKIEINQPLADEVGAYVAFNFTSIERDFGTDNSLYILKQKIVPYIQYKIPNGILTGSNRGEFGGELIFVNKNNKAIKVAEINVEDIYKFDFGYVITSGLAHMSSDSGSIYLVSFEDGKPSLIKLFGLVGAPKTSWKINDKELLINSRSGSQLLTKDGLLRRVQCGI
jgi:hypothetical protein